MNIINYIDAKNQSSKQSLKKINNDLEIVNMILELKRSNNIDSYISVQNQLSSYYQSGGASVEFKQVPFVNFNLDTKSNPVPVLTVKTAIPNILTQNYKFTQNDVTTFMKYVDSKDLTKQKNAGEQINVLVTIDNNNQVSEIEILDSMTDNANLNKILPAQLSTDNDIKLQLYKSLTYLNTQKKYANKFNELITRFISVKTKLASLKEALKKKLSASTLDLSSGYKKQLNDYFVKINSTLSGNVNDYHSIKSQIEQLEELANQLEPSTK
jgi:hypothetical protein